MLNLTNSISILARISKIHLLQNYFKFKLILKSKNN